MAYDIFRNYANAALQGQGMFSKMGQAFNTLKQQKMKNELALKQFDLAVGKHKLATRELNEYKVPSLNDRRQNTQLRGREHELDTQKFERRPLEDAADKLDPQGRAEFWAAAAPTVDAKNNPRPTSMPMDMASEILDPVTASLVPGDPMSKLSEIQAGMANRKLKEETRKAGMKEGMQTAGDRQRWDYKLAHPKPTALETDIELKSDLDLMRMHDYFVKKVADLQSDTSSMKDAKFAQAQLRKIRAEIESVNKVRAEGKKRGLRMPPVAQELGIESGDLEDDTETRTSTSSNVIGNTLKKFGL